MATFVQEVAGGACATRDATVGTLIEQWFELAKADLYPSTVRGYKTCIRCYIKPALGDIPLDHLRVAPLDHLYAQLRTGDRKAGRPLATATIKSVGRIALDPTSVEVLHEHRERAEKRAAACGTSVLEDAYVFSRTADSSKPWPPNDVTHEFTSAWEASACTTRGISPPRGSSLLGSPCEPSAGPAASEIHDICEPSQPIRYSIPSK